MTVEIENDIPEGIKEHLKQIEAWLDENVTIYKGIKSVTMHNFSIKLDFS